MLAVVVWRLWGGTTDHHLHTSTTLTTTPTLQTHETLFELSDIA